MDIPGLYGTNGASNGANGFNGINVSFDLFIDNVSNNLSFLTSQVFNDLFTSILESQVDVPENPVQVPPERIKKFCCQKKIMKQDLNEELCPICLKKFKNCSRVIKPNGCNHLFHFRCLRKWLLYKSNCPVCRQLCSFDDN